mmetsp:Transcript_2950/g.7993  ORF Transcript_2950/g.7993 Transcript_2950/m.7993 type:complete len:205 (-) Transcript_2950:318-932(-)
MWSCREHSGWVRPLCLRGSPPEPKPAAWCPFRFSCRRRRRRHHPLFHCPASGKQTGAHEPSASPGTAIHAHSVERRSQATPVHTTLQVTAAQLPLLHVYCSLLPGTACMHQACRRQQHPQQQYACTRPAARAQHLQQRACEHQACRTPATPATTACMHKACRTTATPATACIAVLPDGRGADLPTPAPTQIGDRLRRGRAPRLC